MASVYVRNNIIYIGWYDSLKGMKKNKSTKLPNTPENIKEVKIIAKKLQDKLDNESSKIVGVKIKRVDLDYAFKHFLKNNADKHKKTIYDYNRFYNKFTERFNGSTLCSSLNKLDVEDWLNDIKLLDFSKNTIFGYYKQLNHFLNFLFEYNYTPMFKINKGVKPKREIKEKIIFSVRDVCLIFKNLDDPKTEKTQSFKTLVYLAFYTGLRSSDLLTITVDRVDLNKREIKYYSPKRKVHRSIAFHNDLVPILTERIAEIKEGKLINYTETEAIGRAFRRFFKQIGIDEKGYTARTFRKTFITLCRSYGMDSSIVAELVGHEHQSTADKFYNRISHELMQLELQKFRRPRCED